jgi:hypothetical protein
MPHRLIHDAILAHVRARLATSSFAKKIAAWSDEQMLRRTFSNYRGAQGLRLTHFGQQIMQYCFQCYEFENTTGEVLPAHLLFLECQAKMPYFWDRKKLVIYDKKFAVYLRLVGGDFATLIEINITD